MNKFLAVGCLGRDPEVITKGCKMSVGIRTKVKDKTLWVRVVCFDKLSELVMEHKHKGDKVFIDGHIEQSETGFIVVAHDVGFL